MSDQGCSCEDCYYRREFRPVATQEQPAYQPGTGEVIWSLVLKDMGDRALLGLHKYGFTLKGRNGRDALVDAYQESLDLTVYLRQALYERDGK